MFKERGGVVIFTFCYDSLLPRAAHKIFKNKWVQNGVEHGENGFELRYHRFTKDELTKTLKGSGFKIVSVCTCRNFPFNHLSSRLDYLIAKIGVKLFGSIVIIRAEKIGENQCH